MIDDGLVQSLLDKKVINNGTRVLVEFRKIDNSQRSLVLKDICTIDNVVKDNTGRFLFKLTRLENKEPVSVFSNKVIEIDGMEPKLLAKAFDLNIDGSKKKLGKRRGRPRKHFPYGQNS